MIGYYKMFSINKIVFIVLFSIFSSYYCFSSLNETDIEDSSKNPQSLGNDVENSYNALKNRLTTVKLNLKTPYIPSINLVESFIDYNYEDLKNINKYFKHEIVSDSLYLESAYKIYQAYESLAYSYINYINDLNFELITLEDVLNVCVDQRIKYLKMHFEKNTRNISFSIQLETWPEKIKEYEKLYLSGASNYPNHLISLANINRYQIHSLLISNLLLYSDKSKISPESIKILSCLKTLHPFFNGQSTDLSHPNAGRADLVRYLSNKKQPLPDFLKPDFVFPFQILKSEATVKSSQKKNKRFRRYKGKGSVKKTKTVGQPSVVEVESESEPIDNTLVEEISPILTLSSVETELESLKSSVPVPSPLLEPEIEEVIQIEKGIEGRESSFPSINLNLQADSILSVKNSNSLKKPKTLPQVKKAKKAIHNAPTGMRKFHPTLAPEEENPDHKVKINFSNKDLKLIDRIFDVKNAGSKVKWGKFETLWFKINGDKAISNPGSGGSHRGLFDKTGRYVGSTFTHGPNQTYSATTIKYLRDALYNVGVRN